VLVDRCGTVWTSPETGKDYLLVADQMLWFGTQLPNSLLNPNQLCAFGVNVNNNPFDLNKDLGIQCDEAFIPCVIRGTIVHFEMCVPTDWELKSSQLTVTPVQIFICRVSSLVSYLCPIRQDPNVQTP
jgi:hypothetical protein